jgi:hypothetical protein
MTRYEELTDIIDRNKNKNKNRVADTDIEVEVSGLSPSSGNPLVSFTILVWLTWKRKTSYL